MAAKRQTTAKPRKFESNLGKQDKIYLAIHHTYPKTVITVEGDIDEASSLELRFIVDSFLKEKGY